MKSSMHQRVEKNSIHPMFFISPRQACLYLRATFCMLILAVTTMVFFLPFLLSRKSNPENSDYQFFRDKRAVLLLFQYILPKIFFL